jgi:hypothetical protein
LDVGTATRDATAHPDAYSGDGNWIVGLWAALDAFADRAGLNGPQCPICNRKSCFIQPRFAGTPGGPSCYGQSISALVHVFGGLNAAATALGYSDVNTLENAV